MARKSNTNAPRPGELTDAAGTVTVGCRLPHGLDVQVEGFGTLHFNGQHSRSIIVPEARGFHGLTSGVSADAWAALQDQYADAKWLKEGFLFAATKSKDAMKEAEELGDRDAGFNQLDPENLKGDLARIEAATEE